jgi:hypothetical protein
MGTFMQGRSLIRCRSCVNARYFTLKAAFARLSHSIAIYTSCDTKCTSTVLSEIFITNRWSLTTCFNYVRKVRWTTVGPAKDHRQGRPLLRCKRIDDEFDKKMKTSSEGTRPVLYRVCGKKPCAHGWKMEVGVVIALSEKSYQEMQNANQSKITCFFTKYDEVMR